MKRIGVLTSYNMTEISPRESSNVRGLVCGLQREGLLLDRDYELLISHTNSLDEHAASVASWLQQGIDLVFSGGSPGAKVIREVFNATGLSAPLVYYGAHPINLDLHVGLEECVQANTACVRIELPLVYSHRNFRLLKVMFPDLKRVHMPFARGTVFCHPHMAERYDQCLEVAGPQAVLMGEDVGYAALRNLCWIIDTEYVEYPLWTANDLIASLSRISPRNIGGAVSDVIVAFNDTYHVPNTPQKLLEYSASSGVPLVWVNNMSMADYGAVADFCNHFETVARHSARFVGKWARGEWPRDIRHVEWNHDVVFTLNLKRMRELGIPELPLEVAAKFFHRILE